MRVRIFCNEQEEELVLLIMRKMLYIYIYASTLYKSYKSYIPLNEISEEMVRVLGNKSSTKRAKVLMLWVHFCIFKVVKRECDVFCKEEDE